MPTYQITTDKGTYQVETDSANPPPGESQNTQQVSGVDNALNKLSDVSTDKPSSPLTPIQSGAIGLVNNPKNIPKALENTGVDPRDITLDEQGNVSVKGININKTGLNNVNDWAGAAAKGLTSNLPLLSQIGGDVAAGLLAPETAGASLGTLAIFNAATSATGEAVRQLASKGISGENLNAAELGGQAALGASAPYVGKVLQTAFDGTKMALVNTLDKVATKDGVDGLVAMGNQIISNLDPKKTMTAIDKIRSGDTRILDNNYADESIFNDTLSSRLFGQDGNIAKNIQQTYTKSGNGPQAAKSLYTDLLKSIPEEDVNTILQQGSSVDRMNKPNALTGLGQDIANATNSLLNVNGQNLTAARKSLIKTGGNIDVDLTDLNNSLIPKLTQIGMLKPVTVGNRIGYTIDPSFDVTATGSTQKNIFSDLVQRFFTKAKPGDYASNVSKQYSAEELAQMVNTGKSPKTVVPTSPVYFPENSMKYGIGDNNFYKKLANVDVQISGNEFDRMGELSPDLAMYLKGLRNKTNEVAKQVRNKSVPYFNAKYGELAETLAPVTKAARSKDGLAMENYMKSLAAGSSEKQLINANDINSILKKSGVNLFDDLNAYRASQSLKSLESPIIRSQIVKGFSNTLEHAYNDNPNIGIYNAVKQAVDSALPKDKQFSDLAETHILAKDLNKDTTNVFKAGFLSHGLQIGSVLGGVTGGIGGAATGGLGGTAIGLALQKPGIRKGLIEFAARRGQSSKSSQMIDPQKARLLAAILSRGAVSIATGKHTQ